MILNEVALCETIKRLGYARDKQVRLYGETFDLVSDPFFAGQDLIVVDALEHSSGRLRRVRIPLNIVHMAKQSSRSYERSESKRGEYRVA